MGTGDRPKIVDAEFEVIKGPDALPAVRRRRRWLTPNGSKNLLAGVEEPAKKPMSTAQKIAWISFALFYFGSWALFVWSEYFR